MPDPVLISASDYGLTMLTLGLALGWLTAAGLYIMSLLVQLRELRDRD